MALGRMHYITYQDHSPNTMCFVVVCIKKFSLERSFSPYSTVSRSSLDSSIYRTTNWYIVWQTGMQM